MALTGGYLVLTIDKEKKLNILIKPAIIRFNGNFDGLKDRFTL